MAVANDILERGYLPKELPPVFTSREYAYAVRTGSITLPSSLRWTELGRHSLARAGGLRRPLSIPHPFHYTRLANAIERGWATEIHPHLAQNRFGVTSPVPSVGPRSLEEGGPADHVGERAARRVGGRYLVITDIQSFYPSVYTHSIAWALHGKDVVKANLSLPQGQRTSFFGDTLDRHVRSAQSGQTMGIPIGPDTSWVIAEIILTSVEVALRGYLPNLRAYRYVDDLEIVCETRAEAEKVVTKLEAALATYELSLNPRKTKVVELPAPMEGAGIDELRRWPFSTHPRRQKSEVVGFFDRLSELKRVDPAGTMVSFAFGRVKRVLWDSAVWPLVERRAATAVINEPSSLRHYSQVLASAVAQGHALDRDVLKIVIESILRSGVELERDYEVTWALWLAIEHQVQISRDVSLSLRHLREPCSVLLALAAHRAGRLARRPSTTTWRDAMVADELDRERWLLSYEARHQGWLKSKGGGDHRSNHPLFGPMAAQSVSFLDLTARVQSPILPLALAQAGGGAGGGGYGLVV